MNGNENGRWKASEYHKTLIYGYGNQKKIILILKHLIRYDISVKNAGPFKKTRNKSLKNFYCETW